MNPGRFMRCVAAVGFLALGSALFAPPVGQAHPASAAPEPVSPGAIGDANVGTPSAPSKGTDAVTGPYFIRTGGAGHRCLNAAGGGTTNGTRIILYDCVNRPNNLWYLDGPYGDGYYYIHTAGAGGRCLNAGGGGTANGTPIILYDCVAAWNNVWYLDGPYGDGYFYIRTGGAGHRCLNAAGGGTANGTRIILYDCVAAWNNVWYFA